MKATRVRAALAARTGLWAADWRQAIRMVAAPLLRSGAVTRGYVDACVTMVETEGPYIVIAPGIALAHARPEAGARELALSLGRFDEPVPFGHPDNDPVHLVFVFAAPEGDSHVQLLGQLARALTAGLADRLRAAPDEPAALRLLEEVAGGDQD